ncbi:MAG: TatD family hydrolase [Victivallaceae bacterium]|nr:TatD family hydrolase [Victivallaceae bacterium]MDD5664422.1 TatD family hydrolase [Victivallaceae bacterium]
MELFDTHFHYSAELPPQEYRAQVEAPEVRFLLAVGGNLEESRQARQFAVEVPDCWFAAGIHPHAAGKSALDLEPFEEFITHPRFAAVGELGLDFYYDNSERSRQFKVLEQFLEKGLEWKRPVIIHLRDKDGIFSAYEEGWQIIREFTRSGGRGVVHCFSGTPAWAEKFLELGMFLGVTGMVTFPKAHNIRETLRVIPLDRLLLETDSPYLAPVPFRGKVNHPGYLVPIAEKVADEKCLTVDELGEITTVNAFRMLNLERPR